MRQWIFTETAEVRCPNKGEWYIDGDADVPIREAMGDIAWAFPIVRLETKEVK